MLKLNKDDIKELENVSNMKCNHWVLFIERIGKNICVHHMVGMELKPLDKEIENLKKEVYSDPEFEMEGLEDKCDVITLTNEYVDARR